jgi:hypothetical protein
MARNRKSSGFTAIRIEGGILPPEFLAVIAGSQAKHQAGGDYGLSRSLSLKDELARYWRIAGDLYTAYAERRDRADAKRVKVGVDDWLVSLLKEVLGFDDLAAVRSITLGDRTFPITHQAFGGAVPALLTTREYDLDRADPRFGEEGRRRAPHGLMQEMLNASDDALWGIVANGAKLRLLRDNPSLTRPAHIEADLDLIFTEQLYPDFAALWLLAHASRLKPVDGKPSNSILERWRAEAHETGERALDHLREGVTEALRQLGNGFLQHPESEPLRAALADGRLSAEGYFQELLRLVYRLLFLFTAEERNLLHGPGVSDEQRAIYAQGYSLARLRERAGKRRHYDRHHDLWQGLKIVFCMLARGEPALALPALGGLFAPEQCSALEAGRVSNERLLEAIRALAFFRTATGLARVNYRDMGTEELGSVYESLLELHPVIDVDATPWTFGFAGEANGEKTKGSERKLTGSYYTPAALVNELIKSALEPVMAEAIKANPADPRAALLDFKIVDPACGSGHFLLAAARRLAAEIARIEAGSDTPDEAARQHALREVVQHCIYGVDRNPLSVELCRTALWIETIEPGKPLGFLDHHIQCGDSLVGVLDPKIITQGIPDEAYKPLTGDDKEICNALKKRNRAAENRARHGDLFVREAASHYRVSTVSLDDMPEESLADIATKRERWQRLHQDPDYLREKHRADLFTAAFFAPKTRATAERVPVTEDLLALAEGQTPRPGVIEHADKLAAKHRFFHWHLAFPDIMRNGGFDVVLGNPPWERIKLQEQEFFASRSPEIAKAPNKAARDRMIKALGRPDARPAEQALLRSFEEAKREAEAASQFIRTGGRYPLTGTGDVNTYAVFAETFLRLINPRGRAGLIVPTGIATDDSTKKFFGEISTQGRLVSLFDFENRERLFQAVDSRMKFCLLTLGTNIEQAEFVFFATNADQLADKRRRFTLSPDDILRINPNTKTAPVFRSQADAELTKKIYARVPVLIDETKGATGNPWSISFTAMFHMSNDSHLFRTWRQLEDTGARREGVNWVEPSGAVWLPLYEAKMIHQFDHRWATYEADGETSRDVTDEEKRRGDFEPSPRYWVPEQEVEDRLRAKGWTRGWLMGWRDITNATNERTVIAGVVPKSAVSNKLPLIFADPQYSAPLTASFAANLAALSFDFVARQKIGGTTLNFFYIKQFPVLPPSTYGQDELDFIVPRVLELTYTSHAMKPFAEDLDYDGPPFAWDPDRRALLRAELDAYFARLYGLTRDELRYILDPAEVYGEDYPSETFRVLKNNEIRQFGEYRTRRLVLEAWDRLERGELAAPSPAIRIAAVQREPVDISTLPDGTWARPMQDQRAETGAQLAAILKAMECPLPARQVRLAALLALEPRLLLPYLDEDEAANWRRLIGTEADPLPPSTPTFVARADAAWGAAVRNLRTNDHLIEDIQAGTWAPGAGLDRFVTEGWPDGRARMVLQALQRQATDTVVAALPTELRDWVDAAAA